MNAGTELARGPAQVGLGVDPERRDAAAALYADADALDALLREAISGSGLRGPDGSPALSGVVGRGATVLVKPNWVTHRNESGEGLDCLVTHPAFLLAVVRAAAECRPARLRIGDAPIQGCDLTKLVPAKLEDAIRDAAAGVPVEVRDFRRVRMQDGGLGRGRVPTGRDDREYVLFDLGKESLLDPLSTPRGGFRVTMYHPRSLNETHRPGRHQYLLAREVFEADVVINLPKLKTHRKAGLTSALKNLVGINGNKDYLPHHRLGGSATGGDCYPGFDPVRRLAEYCLDRANMQAGTSGYDLWHGRAGHLLRLQRRLRRPVDLEGGWHGNDTCWRMVLDLNRLALHGAVDGSIADEPRRRIVSLVDAVVAGEGEGPLAPGPLPLGIVLAGDDSACLDWFGAALLGMDPTAVPLLHGAFGRFRHPITAASPGQIRVGWRGEVLTVAEAAARFGRRARLPEGWRTIREAVS